MPKSKDLKQVLAENVKTMMSVRNLSQPRAAARAKNKGYAIDARTVGRIANADIPTTVDKVDALAAVLGLEPWQLLVPGLDPNKLPALGEVGLQSDELDLLERYRKASGRWKISMRHMAALERDDQQEEAVSYLLSKMSATPAPAAGEQILVKVKVEEGQKPHEQRASYRTKKAPR